MHDTSLWSLPHARHRRGPYEVDGPAQLLMRLVEERLLAVGSIPRVMNWGALPGVRHLLWARP